METGYTGTAVVVPTRNRPDLAVRAVRSALSQPGAGLGVLVSDNSTDEGAARELARFCEGAGDARLRYVRPPEPLPMTAHWGWALGQASGLFPAASHVTYLTDRMVFKPGALGELARAAASYPGAVTSYMHDMVADDRAPVGVSLNEWSGRLLRVRSARLLELSSESFLSEALPRMLNCHVPRAVLSEVEARFGSVFSSISPDFSFCYRALAVTEEVLFYDKALLVHYAIQRSNGASTARGEKTPDHADFLKNLGGMKQNYAAPIPEVPTVLNAIVHEYCVVRDEARSPKFPAVDAPKYVSALAAGVEEFVDPQFRQRMREVLAERSRELLGGGGGDVPLLRKLLSPRRVARRLSAALRGGGGRAPGDEAAAAAPPEPAWSAPDFETFEAALEYACGSPRPRAGGPRQLEEILRGEAVPFDPEGAAPRDRARAGTHA